MDDCIHSVTPLLNGGDVQRAMLPWKHLDGTTGYRTFPLDIHVIAQLSRFVKLCLTLGNNLISLHLLDVVTRLSSPLTGRVETRNIQLDRTSCQPLVSISTHRYRSPLTNCGTPRSLRSLGRTMHAQYVSCERARSASGGHVIIP